VAEATARRVDALLVPGDLFDGEEADVETVNRAVECVRAAGCPPVFIAPGNHDCYSRASTYYDNAKLAARHQPVWPAHVHIFTSPEFASAELSGRPEVRVWGRCVDANVESDDRVLARAPRPGPGLAHVLLLHGSRDGFLAPGKRLTAPFSDAELLAAGFDYAALGHYHEPAEVRDGRGRLRAAYAGSPAALARDETGPHGALLVRLTVDASAAAPEARGLAVETEPVPLDERRLLAVTADLAGVGSPEAVRERVLAALAAAGATPRDLAVARLTGRVRPGVDLAPRAEDFAERVWCLLADVSELRPDYDLEAYRRGEPRTTEERFARSLLAEIDDERDPARRAELESALYYGLDALKQGRVAPRYEWGLE
jgi:DNA repair exonuclease SbcCD nuclease subunit